MNMIEKVARAIREANDAMGGLSTESDYEIAASAAIEAMREPTAAMVDAGGWADNGEDRRLGDENAKLAWQAMIDAVLKAK